MEHPASPSAAEIADYRRDGIACLRGAIPAAWIAALARGVERNMAAPGPCAKRYTPEGKPGLFFGDYCNWPRIAEFRDFFMQSPAAAIAGRLMDANKVNLFHEHVLVKEPGTEEPTPWHHDQPYYFVDGDQICSLWIPLDPVARETCPRYVAGSHRWGKWYVPARFADGKDHPNKEAKFESVPDIDAAPDKYRILSWELAPGDCLAFHGLTVHGAPPNRSANRRRGFAARFTGDDAVFTLRAGYMSPPPPASGGPKPGAPMDSEAFPVVWRA